MTKVSPTVMEGDIHSIQVTAKLSKQMRWHQLHSERQRTHPGPNYTSPCKSHTSLSVIPQLDHEWNYHTKK